MNKHHKNGENTRFDSSHDTVCEEIRARLEFALGSLSNRSVALRTGYNTETVRRYRQTGNTKAAFIAKVAMEYGINADWLLTNRGEWNTINQSGNGAEQPDLNDLLDQLLRSFESRAQRAGTSPSEQLSNTRLSHLLTTVENSPDNPARLKLAGADLAHP